MKMFARMATIKPKNMEERDTVNKFFFEITNHSMYTPILDELMNSPGFVRKEMVIVDDLNGRVATSKIIFADQENFNNYVNNEVNESMWDYLTVMAEESGLTVEVKNIEL